MSTVASVSRSRMRSDGWRLLLRVLILADNPPHPIAAAYKDAEGIPIHHKKILVDVERGRTVKGWKPHKLGGGLGGRPKPVDPVAVAPPMAPVFGGFRGGMRGGDRGGFRGVSRDLLLCSM